MFVHLHHSPIPLSRETHAAQPQLGIVMRMAAVEHHITVPQSNRMTVECSLEAAKGFVCGKERGF
jgi:hypothetical protein